MKLYGAPKTRSDRVTWTLRELGLECEFVTVDLRNGEHRQDEFKKLNPNGKVPVLVDGDAILYESAAICLYLAEKAPEKELLPTDPVLRGLCYQWLFYTFAELEAPLWTKARHTFVYPEKHRIPAIFETCGWEFRERAQTAEQTLEDGREYILGDQFSLADIFLAEVLGWGQSQDLLAGFPKCQAYVARVKARPHHPNYPVGTRL